MKDDSSLTHINQANAKHDIFSAIRALDAGITNHEMWINAVHQSLICRNHHANTADLCEDAHCRCKFGQWIYSADSETLKDLEHFSYVLDKHQQMHALARTILIKNDQHQDIAEQEYKDFTSIALSFKLDVRNLQYELMSQVCVVDHLTGASNRYAMYSKLHQEKERQVRTGHTSTVCMMDLDHFKRVNVDYGHTIGDLVLKSVIDFCYENLRQYDSIYRYGGEEFLFYLPDTEMDEARSVIQRLCTTLSKHPIPLPDGRELFVTASFGIASLQKNLAVEDCIQAADHALLCSKAQGRDRVCCWEEESGTFG